MFNIENRRERMRTFFGGLLSLFVVIYSWATGWAWSIAALLFVPAVIFTIERALDDGSLRPEFVNKLFSEWVAMAIVAVIGICSMLFESKGLVVVGLAAPFIWGAMSGCVSFLGMDDPREYGDPSEPDGLEQEK